MGRPGRVGRRCGSPTTLAASDAAIVWAPATISRYPRATTAALLALTVLAHITLNVARPADPVAWIVDAGLLVTALLLGGSLLKLRQAA